MGHGVHYGLSFTGLQRFERRRDGDRNRWKNRHGASGRPLQTPGDAEVWPGAVRFGVLLSLTARVRLLKICTGFIETAHSQRNVTYLAKLF